jgi:hypothetical protein
MDDDLKKQIERARTLSNAELRSDLGKYTAWSPIHVAAKVELANRESRKTFGRKDIVAWIALGVAILR